MLHKIAGLLTFSLLTSCLVTGVSGSAQAQNIFQQLPAGGVFQHPASVSDGSAQPVGRRQLNIGPKHDDPIRGLTPNPNGPLMIGPKQDDPVRGLTPNPDDRGVLMIGPKQDDPVRGLTPNPNGPLMIGPKQDDPIRGLTPNPQLLTPNLNPSLMGL